MARKRITVRLVSTGLLLVAVGVTVAVGVADSSDVQPPTITVQPFGTSTQIYPAVHDGMTVTDGMLRFRAEVFDASNILTPPVLSLDGNALPADVGHRTPGDDGEGEWDWQTWWVLYSGVIADGAHVLALSASDSLGNAVTATYDLDIVTRPTISELEPVTYGGVLRPVVAAKVSDANTAIDPASITLTLDGTPVAHSYDAATGRVTHVPAADLANESYHTAILRAADAGGLSTTRTWVFYVTTYPDMPDSSMGSCTSCHPPPPPTPGVSLLPWEAMHAATLRFGGELHAVGGSDCWACHGEGSGAGITTPGFVICGQCHGRPGGLGYGEGWYHGQHAGIEYVPALRDPAFPVRIARNREMIDCVLCHQPGVTTLKTTGLAAGSHDIPELHKSALSAGPGCSTCHARSLTREHARDGRRDSNDQAITCETCHRSSDASVVGAIASGNTACGACHPDGDSLLAAHHSTCRDCRVCHTCY